jgi:hypothetical protein
MIPFQSSSQSTSVGEIRRGEVVATRAADSTTVIIHANASDGLLFLEDLLDYELIVDSVIPNYIKRVDGLESKLSISLDKIRELSLQNTTKDKIILNNEEIFQNLKKLYKFKDLTIEELEKQRRLDKLKNTLGGFGVGIGGVGLGIGIGFLLFAL